MFTHQQDMPTSATQLITPVEAFVELVCLSLNAHCAVLFLPKQNNESEEATLKAAFSTQIPPTETTTITHGRGLIGWILRHKQSLVVNDFDKKNTAIGYYDSTNIPNLTAFLGVPFQQGGALCLDRTDGTPFTEHDKNILTSFANYSSLLLPSAEQRAELDEAQHFFEGLSRFTEASTTNISWSAILDLTLQILHECAGFDYAALATLKDDASYSLEAENIPLLIHNGKCPTIPNTQGVIGWVFRNELPVHTEGTAPPSAAPLFGKFPNVPEFQATLCVPVLMNKSLCAVLCMANMEPKIMSHQLRTFIQAITQNLTQYMEHLSLRHRLRKSLPKATRYHNGAVAYDPDSSPSQAPPDED